MDTPSDPIPPDPVDGFEVEGDESATPPRRSASAQLVVDAQVGSEALMREAMDPANQSLREALRLSYRVLQVVILVLVVLFVFSGFQAVETGQTGVMLRWGKILETDGRAALDPGLKFSKWPYPAGEFVLFEADDRAVDVLRAFWPNLRGRNFEDAVRAAAPRDMLRPGPNGDGSLLTQGGDIAHLQLAARYDVDDPVAFVRTVENRVANDGLDADRLVELALERAAVHAAAGMRLQEFVDFGDAGTEQVRRLAQDLLSEIGSGIRIDRVDTPSDPSPALAIKKTYGDLQEAEVQADQAIQAARQEAAGELRKAAGEMSGEIVAAIAAYEDALDLGRPDQAEAVLDDINALLEDAATSGEVASTLNRAKGYRSQIEQTLGYEAQRFAGLLDGYREHPGFALRRLWVETYARVLGREDVEIISVPNEVGMIRLALAGQDRIRQIRRRQSLDERERSALIEGIDLENPLMRSAADMENRLRRRPGRTLTEEGKGRGQ